MTILTRGHFMFMIKDGICITTDLWMMSADDRMGLKNAFEASGEYLECDDDV